MERFLSGKATDEEERLVAAYLKDNPERLDQYLTDGSWEGFEPGAQHGIPSERMRRFLEEKIGKEVKPLVRIRPARRIAPAVAVAASVLLLAGAFAWWRRADSDRPVKAVAVSAPSPLKTTVPPQQAIANTSALSRNYVLPDGSGVRLGAGSRIAFANPFTKDRRDIYLTGEAIFSVRRDKTRPFTVHAKGIATTALGTVFGVDDRRGPVTKVRLYSGRVVVREEAGTGRTFKEVYLSPGQELALNAKDFSVRVRTVEKASAPAAAPSVDTKVLAFNNRSLSDIFETLKKTYNVPIIYHREGVKNIQFTGTFNRDKETLESILNTLCSLNELKAVRQADGGFSIQTP